MSGNRAAREQKKPDAPPTFIVGIGASAGGLEACIAFFDPMPTDTGLAFVLVQHLDPDHESILDELIASHTDMPVRVIQDGTPVEANRVYVVPPDYSLSIQEGVLYLDDLDRPAGLRLPIDAFLRSLAQDQREKAVGVVLSGTGSDGTLGVRAIKETAGMAMAQEPQTAKYASMPQNAIHTGLVDYVLAPADMAPALLDYVQYASDLGLVTPASALAPPPQDALQRILTLLRARKENDFSLYKENTIRRRIERRMAVNQLGSMESYADYLRRQPDEIDALFREMLIGVTSFFRDPEAFAALEKKGIPALLRDRPDGRSIRAWVAGCATGEEAYSIAILLREAMEREGQEVPVQVFATDLDERAIDKARAARYPASIAADVSSQRLERFFVREDEVYQVAEPIRQMVIFAVQSVVRDPPFSRLDLVSCRNLLIYLTGETQTKLVKLFRYALQPGGFLFLGTSESLSAQSASFEVIDQKHKLFRRLDDGRERRFPLDLPNFVYQPASLADPLTSPGGRVQASQVLEKMLLQHHVTPSLVVNEGQDILYTYGEVGRYLEPVAGERSGWNVVHLVREGLRLPLITAVRQAVQEGQEVSYQGARIDLDGECLTLNLHVRPLQQPASLRGLLLVSFEPVEGPAGPSEPPTERAEDQNHRIQELEQELRHTKEYLQATIEELQSSNEEIRSTNEELQSANEELETAQEESQSINEELATLNAELESKVDELTWVNSDLNNLLGSLDVAIIFLDRQMQVRRFNPAAAEIVNLIPSDVGRPLGHISSKLVDGQLEGRARQVFETLESQELEVQTRAGEWYQLRIRPYRTVEDAIEGVVLTFSDIAGQKETEGTVRAARELAEDIIDTVRQPLLVLDDDLRLVSANRAFYQRFGFEPAEVAGRFIYDLGDGQWAVPELRRLLEEIIPQDNFIQDFEIDYPFLEAGRQRLKLDARQVRQADGKEGLILLAIQGAPEGE